MELKKVNPEQSKVNFMCDGRVEEQYDLTEYYGDVVVVSLTKEVYDDGEYAWHDLRENPNDIPKDNKRKLVMLTGRSFPYVAYLDSWSDGYEVMVMRIISGHGFCADTIKRY